MSNWAETWTQRSPEKCCPSLEPWEGQQGAEEGVRWIGLKMDWFHLRQPFYQHHVCDQYIIET